MGSPDANGFAANGTGAVKYRVIVGNLATETNEADVNVTVNLTDVRINPGGADYVGRVLATSDLRLTDKSNATEQPEPGTVSDFKFEFPVDCVATGSSTIGGQCDQNTTANALIPGMVTENKFAIWELGQVSIKDAGPNGTGYASCPPTCGDGDEGTFMRQGVFAP